MFQLKKQMKRILYCAMAAALFVGTVGCADEKEGTDDPTVDNAVDPDLYDVDPQPETDQEEVKMNTTLYFFSDADAATDSCSLKDNFVSRFASAQKWDGVSIPSQGDCLLFNVDEASSIVGNAAGLDALKKMHEAGVLLVMEGGSEKDFERVCRMVENYNPYAVGDAEEEPNGGELPLWIWTGPLPGAASLAMLLEPTDTDGDFTDDFSQGELCDMALTEIKDALAAVNGTAGMSVANGTKSGDEQKELTQLMNATKFYIYKSQKIESSDYRSSKKGSHTNNYQVEFDVWYAFSEDEQRNYYYIHEEISCPFKNTYVGVYSKSVSGIAKVCEWFGRQVDVTFEPVSNANDVKIHRSSPTSTQSSQSYTSGFSWNLGGNVSYKFGGESAGATVGLSGGISVSNSHTYTVNDVTIADNGDNGSECKASWSFILSGVRTTYAPFSTACVNMYEGSLTGRTKLQAGTDFIISTPVKSRTPQFKGTLSVQLKSSCGKMGTTCWERTRNADHSETFTLPAVK